MSKTKASSFFTANDAIYFCTSKQALIFVCVTLLRRQMQKLICAVAAEGEGRIHGLGWCLVMDLLPDCLGKGLQESHTAPAQGLYLHNSENSGRTECAFSASTAKRWPEPHKLC